jgi:hypothetical protein
LNTLWIKRWVYSLFELYRMPLDTMDTSPPGYPHVAVSREKSRLSDG